MTLALLYTAIFTPWEVAFLDWSGYESMAAFYAAFDEYVASLEKANPAFSLVRKLVKVKK